MFQQTSCSWCWWTLNKVGQANRCIRLIFRFVLVVESSPELLRKSPSRVSSPEDEVPCKSCRIWIQWLEMLAPGQRVRILNSFEETSLKELSKHSFTRNIKDTLLTWIISPDIKHNFLLSSRTVFMFSIQTASTGPSNKIHFLSNVTLLANSLKLNVYTGESTKQLQKPESICQNPIRPFVRSWIELTVQLTHWNGFRIDNPVNYRVLDQFGVFFARQTS